MAAGNLTFTAMFHMSMLAAFVGAAIANFGA
jgi:hypothetical protein